MEYQEDLSRDSSRGDDFEELGKLPDSEEKSIEAKSHGLRFEIGKLNSAIDCLIATVKECQTQTLSIRTQTPSVAKNEKIANPERSKCPLGREILKARIGVNTARDGLREILQNLDI